MKDTKDKTTAEEKVNEDYNNPESPHYRDNERYSWAISTINKALKDESNNQEHE